MTEAASTTGEADLRPLHLHTVESLCRDLISGRAVGVGQGNAPFALATVQARSILNWYFARRDRWGSSVQIADIETLVDASAEASPQLAGVPLGSSAAKRHLRLVKIVAHRFGGLHAYSVGGQAPEDFVFEPTADISLFEGWNGSGKTSLLNAVIWCLTGKLLRPQRQPDAGNEEFECRISREQDGGDASTLHALTPVTPLPDPSRETPDPAAAKLPIDTWVELTFADEQGTLLPPVRRAQSRSARGALQETRPDIAALGLDPIAVEVGTTMPGMIAFIQLGGVSELGRAIAQLTGLATLVDLSKHATKVQERLGKERRRAQAAEIETADKNFSEARNDLEEVIEEHPTLAYAKDIPKPSDAPGLEVELQLLEEHFQNCKRQALEDACTILGDAFDPEARAARDELEANIGPARGQMAQLAQLPSAGRLAALAALDQNGLTEADTLLGDICTEAAELAELAAEPSKARRRQLYARVASWMKAQGLLQLDSCAVCGAELVDATDAELGGLVRDHLAHALQSDAELIGQTVTAWAKGRLGQLSQSLPAAMSAELRCDLPDRPGQLVEDALGKELFDTPAFQGVLSGLRGDLQKLCGDTIAALPDFVEPQTIAFDSCVAPAAKDLETALNRLARAAAFAKWRKNHQDAMKTAFAAIIGRSGENPTGLIAPSTPLAVRLSALQAIVSSAAPINRALNLCARMSSALKTRREKEKRLAAYELALAGLNELVALGSLAQTQVEDLRGLLEERASHWRGRIYRNAYSFSGHDLVKSEMDSKGALNILVGSNGASAPAQHISNASALRATLVGFFLAFWEHVFNERGGLKLLVLDDPQELLDDDNRDQLARTLSELAAMGAQLLVTTHDRLFARVTVSEGRKKHLIEHSSVHPVHAGRGTLEVSPSIEELDRKRRAFEQHRDDAAKAQDYVSEARVFIEARLADLFDDPAYPAYSASTSAATLSDHLGRLRGLFSAPPNELFRSPPIRDFVKDSALADGAPCLVLLNKAHHHKAAITYNEVYQVGADLKRLRGVSEGLHAEFRRWRWRDAVVESTAKIVPLRPGVCPNFDVEVHPDLAAFTGSPPVGGSQGVADERFGDDWFADKAFYYVRNENLGFSAPSGSVVVVECEPKPGNDGNLVIAHHGDRVVARRLFRPKGAAVAVALAAETPDRRKSPPTVMADPAELQIHRILGVLFEDIPAPTSKDEAVQIAEAPGLATIETAYRVRGDSALPLALPGQLVLGGACISPDQLDNHEGRLVALTLDDGQSILKRVGPKLPGPLAPARQFESIGGLGASEVVLTEPVEGFGGMPVLVSARAVLGVLYE